MRQAVTAHSPAAQDRAPGNFTNLPPLTRRAILGGALVVPLTVAGAGTVATTGHFHRAHAKFVALVDRADAASTAYGARETLYLARKPVERPSQILPGDTAESYNCRVRQDRLDHADACRVLRENLGLDAAEARMNDFSCRMEDALEALITTPADKPDDTIVKLELAIKYDAEQQVTIEGVLADLKRMAGVA